MREWGTRPNKNGAIYSKRNEWLCVGYDISYNKLNIALLWCREIQVYVVRLLINFVNDEYLPLCMSVVETKLQNRRFTPFSCCYFSLRCRLFGQLILLVNRTTLFLFICVLPVVDAIVWLVFCVLYIRAVGFVVSKHNSSSVDPIFSARFAPKCWCMSIWQWTWKIVSKKGAWDLQAV